MPDPVDVPAVVEELARRLAKPKPMRRGSLSVRYLKCNKPGCACAEDPDARHGPYTSVVRTVRGQTRSRLVPAAQAALLRQQIESGQRFRKDVEAYWQACETWADAEIDAAQAASQEAAKKGGSKKRSTRKSSPRSKRS
jgi:hypothetical protein